MGESLRAAASLVSRSISASVANWMSSRISSSGCRLASERRAWAASAVTWSLELSRESLSVGAPGGGSSLTSTENLLRNPGL